MGINVEQGDGWDPVSAILKDIIIIIIITNMKQNNLVECGERGETTLGQVWQSLGSLGMCPVSPSAAARRLNWEGIASWTCSSSDYIGVRIK
jgi:hypothetical protein